MWLPDNFLCVNCFLIVFFAYPKLSLHLQITKLTCGSLITFYDSHRPDATVAVDVCLTSLILAKVKVHKLSKNIYI